MRNFSEFRVFDDLRLETLAASVTAQGVIEPLIVSQHPEVVGRYMLIACHGARGPRSGERAEVRTRAP